MGDDGVVLSPRRRHTLVVVGTVLGTLWLAAWLALGPSGLGAEVRARVGLGATPGDQPGPHHAFLQTQRGGAVPVGWDPCRPVPYVVDPAGAPAGWEGLLGDALDDVATASGLTFADRGRVDDRRFDDRLAVGPSPDPVLIGWADSQEVPGLRGDVAGLGGAVSVLVDGRRFFRTGSLVLDRGTFADLAARPGGDDVERAIVLHELGHVVGLGHVDDPGELMHQEGVPRTDYGPGDLEGLAALGALRCG